MMRVTKDGEFELTEMDYLVIEIPEIIPIDKLLDDYSWQYALQVNKKQDITEISMFYPRVYNSSLLRNLEKLGYIKVTQKETIIGEGTYYVDAKGWQIGYNLIQLLFESIKIIFAKKKRQSL